MHDLELRFDGITNSRSFSHATEVLQAKTPTEAFAALARAQQALQQGYAIAGCLSYEFGYACLDLPLPGHALSPNALPLLLLGIYAPEAIHPPTAAERDAPVLRAHSPFVPRTDRAQYAKALREIQRLLHEGDLYQVNYTVPFDFEFSGSAQNFYHNLGASSKAPHRAYLQTANYSIVSFSPELFLEFDRDTLRTKPMKGTARRGQENELSLAKNRAEHVMIVDLLRNDLGQVCSSVQVEALFATEYYPTFATMTSTIVGKRQPGVDLTSIFRALFPCGSVTGAPKRSAVREIGRLEQSPRGAYCGSLGYLLPDGTGSWNVAIRTLQLDHRTQHGRLDLGGGIVADSQPDAEWDEILVKGKLFQALSEFQV
jgi:anthranilate/para-aminobenzoate synthase component I